ncbi:hypothetical protein ACLB2K_015181 [Fragaria x ananassa]
MGIPRMEHAGFIESVYRVVRKAVPEVPLHMVIVDVTVARLGCFEADPEYINRTRSEIRECIQAAIHNSFANSNNTDKVTPSVKPLEKRRLNDLEEATLRQNPLCAICLEEFTKSPEELITPLPCKHYYHAACIVKSLKIRLTCPMCRYPMPLIAEVLHETKDISLYRYI